VPVVGGECEEGELRVVKVRGEVRRGNFGRKLSLAEVGLISMGLVEWIITWDFY
jgi:hypothetical protein